MTEKRINLGASDVAPDFFAHEMAINFNPTQFIFDFKCITPRNDPRSKDAPFINIRHNIVMVDVHHAKKITELLTDMLKKYEEQYGRIQTPKPMKMAEKKRKKEKKKEPKKAKTKAPEYFG